MQQQSQTITRNNSTTMVHNRVIRNTYLLLSLTLFTGAIAAWFSMTTHAVVVSPVLFILLYFGLFFATTALRNSPWGLLCVFALTGFMGYTLGPILNLYLHSYINGAQIIGMALGCTGIVFLGLSMYALTTRKDFSYLGGFIFVACLVAFLAGLVAMFFQLPTLYLLTSGAFTLISAGYILFITSQLVNGGETNYIMATVMLYVSIFNMFISLLNIFGAFGGRR